MINADLGKDIIVIDTETGGTNPKTDGLCSVSLKVFGGKKATDKMTIFIEPNNKLIYTKEAFFVNGLNSEFLEINGIDENSAVLKIIEFIKEHYEKRPNILGHSVKFDYLFLCELFSRNNLNIDDFFNYKLRDSKIVADFLKDASVLDSKQSTSLSDLYVFLTGKDSIGAHSSEFDVLMTEEVYCRLINLVNKSYTW